MEAVSSETLVQTGLEHPGILDIASGPFRKRAESWLHRAALVERAALERPISGLSRLVVGLTICLVIVFFPFSLFFCIRVVKEYEKAVILRLGRLLKGDAKGPGVFFILPCIDSFQKIDMRIISLDVAPQQILSRDSVTVVVDAVVFFHIYNPTISVIQVSDAYFSTRLLAQTTLRNTLGTKTLSEILSERDEIAVVVHQALDEGTYPWGVKVDRVEVKDIRLPTNLYRAMAAEAEAVRVANAKVMAAEGEEKASRIMSAAADIISSSPAALYLRRLHALKEISAEYNETIVFPLPRRLFSRLINRYQKKQLPTQLSKSA